jgi:transposase InsO family protein
MSESPVDSVLYSEETLSDELPDAALEVAASKYWERAGNLYPLHFALDWTPAPARHASSRVAACS